MWWKLTAPLRVLYKIYFAIVFLCVGLPQYPLYVFLLRTRRIKTLFFFKRNLWVPLLQFFLFVPMRKIRKPGFQIPEGPYVVCANHASYLDIMLLYRILPGEFIFMGKEELKKFPIIGLFFKRGDLHIAVNRGVKAEASKSLEKIAEKVDEGYPVILFPEGTTTRNPPYMGTFKFGAFKLAIEKQIPILPITFVDNWKRLSNPAKLKGHACPGLSRVVLHPPVSTLGMTSDDLVSLQEQVRECIENGLREYLPNYFPHADRQ